MSSSIVGTPSGLVHMAVEEPLLPVRLHPLVILNITHHVTRIQLCVQDTAPTHVLGVLLGHTISDGGTEIVTSYEVVLCEPTQTETATATTAVGTSEGWCVDWASVKEKRERLAEVFPELAVVGWYSVGGRREDLVHSCSYAHMALCEAFDDVSSEVMFALMVDCAPQAESATLPVHLFEAIVLHDTAQQQQQQETCEEANSLPRRSSSTRISATASSTSRITVNCTSMPGISVGLTKIKFLLDSDEITQAGLDAAMNNVSADSQSSSAATATVTPQLQRIEQSLRLLKQNIVLVVEYLKAVESGRIADPDPEILRHVAKVCAMLPTTSEEPSLSCSLPSSISRNSNSNANSDSNSVPSGGIDVSSAVEEEERHSLTVALLSLQTKCTLELCQLLQLQKRLT